MSGPSEEFTVRPPSKVIEQIIDPLEIGNEALYSHEKELLEKPVLGKNGHAEALFRRFAGHIVLSQNPRGINVLKTVIMPAGLTPREIRDEVEITRVELGLGSDVPIIFNTQFSGHLLELYHTQVNGVYSMTLTDRHELPQRQIDEPFSWEDPSIPILRQELEIGSSVSIHRTDERGRGIFLQGIISGQLVRSEVTRRAELGFAELCDQLKWS